MGGAFRTWLGLANPNPNPNPHPDPHPNPNQVGGAFHTAVAPALRPAFGAVGAKPLFPSSLVLISMVCYLVITPT